MRNWFVQYSLITINTVQRSREYRNAYFGFSAYRWSYCLFFQNWRDSTSYLISLFMWIICCHSLTNITTLSTPTRKIKISAYLLYYNMFPSTQLIFKYNINATCFDLWQSSSGWSKNRLTFHRFYFVHLGSHMPYTV